MIEENTILEVLKLKRVMSKSICSIRIFLYYCNKYRCPVRESILYYLTYNIFQWNNNIYSTTSNARLRTRLALSRRHSAPRIPTNHLFTMLYGGTFTRRTCHHKSVIFFFTTYMIMENIQIILQAFCCVSNLRYFVQSLLSADLIFSR